MLKKTIQIKTNLLTILIVVTVIAAGIAVYATNGMANLFFALLSPDRVETVTVHSQFRQQEANLSDKDIQALVPLLKSTRLKGDSVRIFAGESLSPQYTVTLKSGLHFDIACYDDHYIINGRGYSVGDKNAQNTQYANYIALGKQYLEYLENEAYFPREAKGVGS